LQVLQIIRKYGMNAAIGINNVGNAFTPQGSCDPLSLASFGVGLYQAATTTDTDLLLVCQIYFLYSKLADRLLSNAYQIEQSWPWGLTSPCRTDLRWTVEILQTL
jgi:hypothetical protein